MDFFLLKPKSAKKKRENDSKTTLDDKIWSRKSDHLAEAIETKLSKMAEKSCQKRL